MPERPDSNIGRPLPTEKKPDHNPNDGSRVVNRIDFASGYGRSSGAERTTRSVSDSTPSRTVKPPDAVSPPRMIPDARVPPTGPVFSPDNYSQLREGGSESSRSGLSGATRIFPDMRSSTLSKEKGEGRSNISSGSVSVERLQGLNPGSHSEVSSIPESSETPSMEFGRKFNEFSIELRKFDKKYENRIIKPDELSLYWDDLGKLGELVSDYGKICDNVRKVVDSHTAGDGYSPDAHDVVSPSDGDLVLGSVYLDLLKRDFKERAGPFIGSLSERGARVQEKLRESGRALETLADGNMEIDQESFTPHFVAIRRYHDEYQRLDTLADQVIADYSQMDKVLVEPLRTAFSDRNAAIVTEKFSKAVQMEKNGVWQKEFDPVVSMSQRHTDSEVSSIPESSETPSQMFTRVYSEFSIQLRGFKDKYRDTKIKPAKMYSYYDDLKKLEKLVSDYGEICNDVKKKVENRPVGDEHNPDAHHAVSPSKEDLAFGSAYLKLMKDDVKERVSGFIGHLNKRGLRVQVKLSDSSHALEQLGDRWLNQASFAHHLASIEDSYKEYMELSGLADQVIEDYLQLDNSLIEPSKRLSLEGSLKKSFSYDDAATAVGIYSKAKSMELNGVWQAEPGPVVSRSQRRTDGERKQGGSDLSSPPRPNTVEVTPSGRDRDVSGEAVPLPVNRMESLRTDHLDLSDSSGDVHERAEKIQKLLANGSSGRGFKLHDVPGIMKLYDTINAEEHGAVKSQIGSQISSKIVARLRVITSDSGVAERIGIIRRFQSLSALDDSTFASVVQKSRKDFALHIEKYPQVNGYAQEVDALRSVSGLSDTGGLLSGEVISPEDQPLMRVVDNDKVLLSNRRVMESLNGMVVSKVEGWCDEAEVIYNNVKDVEKFLRSSDRSVADYQKYSSQISHDRDSIIRVDDFLYRFKDMHINELQGSLTRSRYARKSLNKQLLYTMMNCLDSDLGQCTNEDEAKRLMSCRGEIESSLQKREEYPERPSRFRKRRVKR